MANLRLFGFLCVVVIVLSDCAAPRSSGTVKWSLSPDGGDLAFNWCGAVNEHCTIASYNFEADKLSLYRNSTGYDWGVPSFSLDGRQLAFSVTSPDSKDAQIAIMNADGSGYREVTEGIGYRNGPAFSSDGKLLTYLCVGAWSRRYWTPYKGNVKRHVDPQLCIFRISSGHESIVTDLNSYSYTQPQFLPDNEHLLFHYQSLDRNPNTGEFEQFNLVHNIYTRRSASVLAEIPLASWPRSSVDSKRVVFMLETNEMDDRPGCCDYDLFLWEGTRSIRTSKGTIRRLTNAGSYLSGFAISGDGKKIAYAFDKERNGKMDFYLMDIDSGAVRQFVIPENPSGWFGPEPALKS